jgi:hypothetical protein
VLIWGTISSTAIRFIYFESILSKRVSHGSAIRGNVGAIPRDEHLRSSDRKIVQAGIVHECLSLDRRLKREFLRHSWLDDLVAGGLGLLSESVAVYLRGVSWVLLDVCVLGEFMG